MQNGVSTICRHRYSMTKEGLVRFDALIYSAYLPTRHVSLEKSVAAASVESES